MIDFYQISEIDIDDKKTFLAIDMERCQKMSYLDAVMICYKYKGEYFRKVKKDYWVQVKTPTHFAYMPNFTLKKFKKPSDEVIKNLTGEQALYYLSKDINLVPNLTELVKQALKGIE